MPVPPEIEDKRTKAESKPLFPFLDLKAQFAGIRQEVVTAVLEVLESQHFILGSEVEALEREIAREVGCSFAVACASGSDALLLALMALEIGPGDEVITTPFTFVATAGSIARLGARPVFVDIEPKTYNLDPHLLEKSISPRTRAIIPVHLFGLPADMESILEIGKAHQLSIIEDAAQSITAQYHGKAAGSMGTFGCFSFFPSKNLGGAGDGGMVTTNDPVLTERVRILRTHGSRRKYQYEILGMNSRLDALQAAILRVKLQHLGKWSELRRHHANDYRRLWCEHELQSWITLPFVPPAVLHAYNQFVVRCRKRDEVQQHLRAAGIATEIYYPFPLHLQPAFKNLGYRTGDFPEAELACREVLALPIFPEMTAIQQQQVVAATAEFYRICN